MFNLCSGIFFLGIGVYFIYTALRLQRTKDINLIKNGMVNIDKIKDKDAYIKFNFRFYIIVGGVIVLEGLLKTLRIYFPIMKNISDIVNVFLMIIIFVYFYKFIFKAPKF